MGTHVGIASLCNVQNYILFASLPLTSIATRTVPLFGLNTLLSLEYQSFYPQLIKSPH